MPSTQPASSDEPIMAHPHISRMLQTLLLSLLLFSPASCASIHADSSATTTTTGSTAPLTHPASTDVQAVDTSLLSDPPPNLLPSNASSAAISEELSNIAAQKLAQAESQSLRGSLPLGPSVERRSDYNTALVVLLAAAFGLLYASYQRLTEAQLRRRCRQLVDYLRRQALPGCSDLCSYYYNRARGFQKLTRRRSTSWPGSNAISSLFNGGKGRPTAKGKGVIKGKEEAAAVELKTRGPFSPRLLVPESPSGNAGSASRFRSVLSEQHVARLVQSLPRRYSVKNWELVYGSEVHGYSLYTAYRRFQARRAEMSTTPGFLLVVMDANQYVFGVFCTENLQVKSSYFGTGESFLAKIHPEFQTFQWTGKNSQFVLAKEDMLAFGGGGKFALWLDSSFEKGTSDAGSPTFDNPCIASVENFKCISIEVWGFTNANKLPRSKG